MQRNMFKIAIWYKYHGVNSNRQFDRNGNVLGYGGGADIWDLIELLIESGSFGTPENSTWGPLNQIFFDLLNISNDIWHIWTLSRN